jgi:hypothetical protein
MPAWINYSRGTLTEKFEDTEKSCVCVRERTRWERRYRKMFWWALEGKCHAGGCEGGGKI